MATTDLLYRRPRVTRGRRKQMVSRFKKRAQRGGNHHQCFALLGEVLSANAGGMTVRLVNGRKRHCPWSLLSSRQ